MFLCRHASIIHHGAVGEECSPHYGVPLIWISGWRRQDRDNEKCCDDYSSNIDKTGMRAEARLRVMKDPLSVLFIGHFDDQVFGIICYRYNPSGACCGMCNPLELPCEGQRATQMLSRALGSP